MGNPLATDPAGNALVDVTLATSEQLDEAAGHTPWPLVLVVLVDQSTSNVFFGLNRWRGEYELPGGVVEDGEPFVNAARRELDEETAIRIESLDLIGFARFDLAAPRREELAAVYVASEVDPQAQPSEELRAFVWRTPLSASNLPISPLDDAIAEWAIGSGRRG